MSLEQCERLRDMPRSAIGFAPSWCGNKYNCPVVVPYATGVYVRYMSPYDSLNRTFTATTVPHASNTPFAGTCYMGSAAYFTAGCDHFGVHLAYTAAAIYFWKRRGEVHHAADENRGISPSTSVG